MNEVRNEFQSLESAQAEVMKNAANAYKTAGLSQNEYMESVTSFAAALKQSTANELEAAKAADQAIIDMSDNANKMGTSMEAIQNAYQGFAKQNYTMLDNLKLGYGGTKEEMARLIEDAEKLSGMEYDMGNLSDVYEAIHVIQTDLGITGTTIKEAEATISGSLSMMKSSWSNLITGIADENANFDQLITNFVDSTAIAAENLIPRFETAIGGVGQLIESLLPVVVERIPVIFEEVIPNVLESGGNIALSLMQGFSDNLPTIIESSKGIVTSLIQGITTALPELIGSISGIVTQLYTAISEEGPVLLEAGYTLLYDLISGFVEGIPNVLPKILEFVQGLGDTLAEQAPIWIQKGFEMLSMLVDGIVSAFPILVERVPEIISTFANIINDNFPTILAKGVELIWQLITGLLSAIPTIIANIPQIISAIVDAFMAFQWINLGGNLIKMLTDGVKSMIGAVKGAGDTIFAAFKTALQNLPATLSNLGSNAIQIMCNAINGLLGLAKGAATTIFNGIVSVITTLPSKLISIGGEIVKGLWKGITDNAGWIMGQIGEFASGIINKVKGVFKVESPSKEFAYIGKMCVAGFDVGTEDFEDSAENIERTAGDMTRNIKASMGTMSANTSVSRKEEFYANMNSSVNVYLEGDAKGLFKMVRTENDIYHNKTGMSAFAY